MAQIKYKIDTTQEAKMNIENSNCIVFSLDVYRSNKTLELGKNNYLILTILAKPSNYES